MQLSFTLLGIVLSDDVKFALNFFHPALMWGLFATTLYAAYLGFKWRSTRQMEAGEEKKALVKERFNDKHYVMGSAVLAVMVIGNVGGMAVTYLNNGKLFVSAHLLAGLGMTALIATSAALSPQMQKGKDWARSGHIALNTIVVGLFGWQAVTGVQIVLRILSN
jgi:hypothetical protein